MALGDKLFQVAAQLEDTAVLLYETAQEARRAPEYEEVLDEDNGPWSPV